MLFHELKVPGNVPTTTEGYIKAIAKHVDPTLTGPELEEIVKNRGCKLKEQVEIPIRIANQEELDWLATEFHEEDEVINDLINKHKEMVAKNNYKNRQNGSGEDEPAPAGSSAASSSAASSSAGPVVVGTAKLPIQWVPGQGLTQQQANKYPLQSFLESSPRVTNNEK